MIERTHMQTSAPSLYGATLFATSCGGWAREAKVTDNIRHVTCSHCQALAKRRKKLEAKRMREMAA